MDDFFGLPAHPLIVHIPVAMLPLAGLGVVVLLARRAWYERYRWAVLFVGAVGTIGAILAASSGEGLEERIRERDGVEAARAVHDHVEAGDLARVLAIVFFVALAAFVLVPWWSERRAERAAEGTGTRPLPRWARPAMSVAVAITAVASVVSIVAAGHSGAERAWEEYDTSALVVDG